MSSNALDPVLISAAAGAIVLVAVGWGLLRRRRRRRGPRWLTPMADALRLTLEGNRDEATRLLHAEVDAGSGEPGLFLALGALLRVTGSARRAAALHRRVAIRRDVDLRTRAEALRQATLDYLAEGDGVGALKAAEEALLLDPDDPEVLMASRDAAYEAGDFERALALHYRWVKVSKQPGKQGIEASILAALGSSSLDQGAGDRCKRYLKRARGVMASHPRVRMLHSRWLRAEGSPEAAIDELEAVVESFPSLSDHVLPHLATTLQAAGRYPALDAIASRAAAAAEHPTFVCRRCQHETPELSWRCQECASWVGASRVSLPARM